MQNILIVFLKYPEPGRVKTRLAATIGAETASDIYRSLAMECLSRLLPSASYDCWIFFDPPERARDTAEWLSAHRSNSTLLPQSAGDLGARMADAFRRSFEEGHARRTVIIGTDCPAVDREVVESAFRALEECPVVLGPSTDGGYYLLGTSADFPWLFKEIAWSTDAVFHQTVRALQARDCVWATLAELQDIDTEEDLERLRPGWRRK